MAQRKRDFVPPKGWRLITELEWQEYQQLVREALERRVGAEANLASPSRTAEASAPITEQRQPDYGDPSLNFSRQALIWSGILANQLLRPITPQQVALMMIGVKLGRLAHNPDHADSILDIGGYLTCLEQVNDMIRDGFSRETNINLGTVAERRARSGRIGRSELSVGDRE